MMGVTTVLNCAGVNKEKFIEYTEKNPAILLWQEHSTKEVDV